MHMPKVSQRSLQMLYLLPSYIHLDSYRSEWLDDDVKQAEMMSVSHDES